MNAEGRRLVAARAQATPWRKWGPYLSERQWGTVREDYSASGDAWTYLSHDAARSFAYRWGEDGLAGISRRPPDPLLRARAVERAGPDPQGTAVRPDQPRGQPRRGRQGVLLLPRQHADALVHAVPVQVPAARRSRTPIWSRPTAGATRSELEYELIDTGVFDDDRYFDVFVEYAKASPEDLLIRDHRLQPRPGGGAAARAADAVVPQHLAGTRRRAAAVGRSPASDGRGRRQADQPGAGQVATSTAEGEAELLFVDNETNP